MMETSEDRAAYAKKAAARIERIFGFTLTDEARTDIAGLCSRLVDDLYYTGWHDGRWARWPGEKGPDYLGEPEPAKLA